MYNFSRDWEETDCLVNAYDESSMHYLNINLTSSIYRSKTYYNNSFTTTKKLF